MDVLAVSGTPQEDSAVADFLRILEEHRRSCERQGKYVEAEIAKNRLEELRTHEELRRREALKARQHAERVGVEEAHELEYQQVCALWDRKMEEYEGNALALQHQLSSRQEVEANEVKEKFQNDAGRRPKFSRELLNLRRIEATLAKAQDYAEAHKVKLKADNMELWELERMKGDVSSKWNAVEAKVVAQHENEMKALAKRIQAGREMQNKQREMDLKRLLLRFKNLKADLLTQQALERQKLEKILQATKRSVGREGQGSPNTSTAANNNNITTSASNNQTAIQTSARGTPPQQQQHLQPSARKSSSSVPGAVAAYGSPMLSLPAERRSGPGTKVRGSPPSF